MRKTEIAILFSLIITVCLCSFSSTALECEKLYDGILRLHVIAHDNSDIQQNLKLKVRDEVLKVCEKELSNTASKQNAIKSVQSLLPEIEKSAERVISENGFSLNVKAEISQMFFSTKQYDSFTLPSGVYDALRITIGEGEGKNWWCVCFPPMCISACIDREELSAALGEDGEALLEKSPKYVARFKILEWVQGLFTKAERYEK